MEVIMFFFIAYTLAFSECKPNEMKRRVMIKYIATTGATHQFKFNMADLMTSSLAELVEAKYPGGTITEMKDTSATVVVGESHEVMIDPVELISKTAESIIKTKLKTRKKLVITVGKK
jgi:hypothetical protein